MGCGSSIEHKHIAPYPPKQKNHQDIAMQEQNLPPAIDVEFKTDDTTISQQKHQGLMNALVKKERAPGLWLEKVPIPILPPNHVLVKIQKTAICGTDLHIYNWDKWSQETIPVPMHVGHEFAGIIVELGPGVSPSTFEIGERVSAEGHITCSNCRNCRAGKRHLCKYTIGIGVHRPGCFAEYLSLPAVNVFRLPDSISDEIASIMDPFGNATHTALSFDCVGEDVLITGAGPIGCMAAAICKHVGARHIVITDLLDYRLDLAKKLGATVTINIRGKDTTTELKHVMEELDMTEGFDVGLEMSGAMPAIRSMLEIMNQGSKIALLGIPSEEGALNLNEIIFKGLFIKGIYGREIFETWYKMVTMLQSGLDITPVLTHEFDAQDFEDAFQVMKSGYSGKVILDWTKF